MSEFLADLVQHVVQFAILGVVLVEFGFIGQSLVQGNNSCIGAETKHIKYTRKRNLSGLNSNGMAENSDASLVSVLEIEHYQSCMHHQTKV